MASSVAPATPPRDLRWAAAAVLAFGGMAVATLPAAGSSAQMTALLAGVATVGAPHGVFDIPLALRAAPARGRSGWLAAWLGLYLGLITLVVLGWRIVPAATLVLFLLAAAVHFGGDAEEAGGERDLFMRAALGGAVIVAPMLFHSAETAAIFALLTRSQPATVEALLHRAAPILGAAWASAGVMALLRTLSRKDGAGAILLLALAALFTIAPPLAAFAIYFCLVHAPLHIRAATRLLHRPQAPGAASEAGRGRSLRWAVMWLAPAALLTGALLLLAVRLRGAGAAGAWMFQGLAALTLPHLVLTPWLERRAGRAPRASFPPRTPWRDAPAAAIAAPNTAAAARPRAAAR